ncbi:MAG TPA: hypothetical protein VF591_10875 [Pyrinomonadaceae bacterium]|jgi:hypothetical protein
MAERGADETLIRSYLLGVLTDDEADALEERLIADDELYDAMLIGEEDLIDAYARGELDPQEAERFEARLTSPGRRRRAETSKFLLDYAEEAAGPKSPSDPGFIRKSEYQYPGAKGGEEKAVENSRRQSSRLRKGKLTGEPD